MVSKSNSSRTDEIFRNPVLASSLEQWPVWESEVRKSKQSERKQRPGKYVIGFMVFISPIPKKFGRINRNR